MRTTIIQRLLAGDLTPLGGPPAGEDIAGSVRASQLALVLKHTPGMMLANIANACVLPLALWASPARLDAVAWSLVVICCAGLFGLRAKGAWRNVRPSRVSRNAIHRLVRNAFVLGCLWAIVPAWFFAPAAQGGQLVITCLCAGMLSGGAFSLAAVPVAAIAFMSPILVGAAIGLAGVGEFAHLLVAVLLAVYASAIVRIILAYAFEYARRSIAEIEAEQASRLDTVTRLPNRIAFDEFLERSIATLDHPGSGFGLVLLGLGALKEINEQLGYPAGSEFLSRVAARISRSLQAGEFAARLSGSEIAVLVPSQAGVDDTVSVAHRLVALVSAPVHLQGRDISASPPCAGVVFAPADGTTATELLRNLDAALHAATKAGPGAVRPFDAAHDNDALKRLDLYGDLKDAIARRQLSLVYQPFFSLRDNKIVGFEALLRWNHPVRGAIPPSEFIPLAEATGLIHAIGAWVFEQACATLAGWPAHVRMAVNVSAVQFRRAELLPVVLRALRANNLLPSRLEIEITESVLLSEHEAALGTLRSLSELGIQVVLDDFGTGYSSLSYLTTLPFSRLKIDQSFTRQMLASASSAAIVKSIIALSKELGMEVVAEGVETTEQMAYLREAACDEVQGYHISRPLSEADARALIEAGKQDLPSAA